MTLRISRRDVEEAFRFADRSLSRARDPDQAPALKKLLRTGEVLGGSAAVGFLSGRYGPDKMKAAGVPLDLIAGVVGKGVAFFGLTGKLDEHVDNVADGVLAAYVTKMFVGIGTKVRANAGEPPVVTSGYPYKEVFGDTSNPFPRHGGMPYGSLSGPPPHIGGQLTEAELVALSQRSQRKG